MWSASVAASTLPCCCACACKFCSTGLKLLSMYGSKSAHKQRLFVAHRRPEYMRCPQTELRTSNVDFPLEAPAVGLTSSEVSEIHAPPYISELVSLQRLTMNQSTTSPTAEVVQCIPTRSPTGKVEVPQRTATYESAVKAVCTQKHTTGSCHAKTHQSYAHKHARTWVPPLLLSIRSLSTLERVAPPSQSKAWLARAAVAPPLRSDTSTRAPERRFSAPASWRSSAGACVPWCISQPSRQGSLC